MPLRPAGSRQAARRQPIKLGRGVVERCDLVGGTPSSSIPCRKGPGRARRIPVRAVHLTGHAVVSPEHIDRIAFVGARDSAVGARLSFAERPLFSPPVRHTPSPRAAPDEPALLQRQTGDCCVMTVHPPARLSEPMSANLFLNRAPVEQARPTAGIPTREMTARKAPRDVCFGVLASACRTCCGPVKQLPAGQLLEAGQRELR